MSLPYSLTAHCDRQGLRRPDAAFLAAQAARADAAYVPVWNGQSLFAGDQPHPLGAEAAARLGCGDAHRIFLGTDAGRPYFALDLNHLPAPLDLLADPALRFADLRRVAGAFHAAGIAWLAYARAMVHWHARHRFCGVCGGACESREGGHRLVCGQCGAQHFPRTDAAVIMLVTRGAHALLAHAVRHAAGVYSTLAGFVEPGESLEDAVRREVMEETGIRIGAVSYRASQPWPFPSSLMIGFRAEAQTDAIITAPEEIAHARWFTRAEIADPAQHGFALPPRDSIAHALITEWRDGPAC